MKFAAEGSSGDVAASSGGRLSLALGIAALVASGLGLVPTGAD